MSEETRALARIVACGKASAADLTILGDGVRVCLAQRLGVTAAELRDVIAAGGVSAADVLAVVA